MKYYYQKPDLYFRLYGEHIDLDHPVYKAGTLYLQEDKGLVVVQQKFELGYSFWDSLDQWLANDIYLNSNFPEYFAKNCTEAPYPIVQIRKLMWALRMKPLKREFWEEYF